MNDKSMIIGALALLVIVGGVLYMTSGNTTNNNAPLTASTTPAEASGPNVPLAQCLKDKGVVFYGAFWCPHCKAQKAEFGDAVPALPYVECSTADGQDQTPICKEKGIKSYPTWKFPDGSELTGEQTFATLATKSSCTQALPAGAAAASSTVISPTPATTMFAPKTGGTQSETKGK
jgi:thiol-disulfide isomerase/thioredoxin